MSYSTPFINTDTIDPSYFSQLSNLLGIQETSATGDSPPVDTSSPESSTSSNDSGANPHSAPAPAKSNMKNSKRKTAIESSSAAAHKDRRQSASGSDYQHTHDISDPEDYDDDHPANLSTSSRKSSGKGTTTERRKEQNRVAQRNFRSRKEQHLKELEERLGNLEERAVEQANENKQLKELVGLLQAENARLISTNKRVESNSLPANPAPASDFTFSSSDIDPLNYTPLSEAALRGLAATADTSYSVPVPSTSSAPTRTSSTGDRLASLASSPRDTFKPSAYTESTVSSSTPAPLTPANNELVDIFGTGKDSRVPDFSDLIGDGSLFTDWRDPTNSYNNAYGNTGIRVGGLGADLDGLNDNEDASQTYEDLFKNVLSSTLASPPSVTTPGVTTDLLTPPDPLNVSAPLLSQSPVAASPQTSASQPAFDPNCPFSAEKQAKLAAIRAANPTLDIDSLCSEMRSKATCQESAKRALENALKFDQGFTN